MGQKVSAIIEYNTKIVSDSITRPANTTAYTIGDAISDATDDAHFTFEDAVRPQGGRMSGVISSARIFSDANQTTKLACDLLLFGADITATADNAAFAPTDAHALQLVGRVRFETTDWVGLNLGSGATGNAVAEKHNLAIVFNSTSTVLYGQLVAQNAYTPVSGEIFTVRLGITQD